MKTILNFPRYKITLVGRVWSCITNRFLQPEICNGYLYVNLRKDKQTFHRTIHSLMLETFIEPRPRGKETCHNNGIRHDNRLSNLRYGTRKENMQDKIKHGTCYGSKLKGFKHSMAKLNEQKTRIIIYMWRTGLFLQKEIAKIYNVSTDTVKRIVNKRSWKHIWNKI